MIKGKWSGSFCLCAIFDICIYLLRTVETETTRFSVGYHSARTVLAVTWRLHMITLRYVSFLAVVARWRPVRGRSSWDLLCWYHQIVLLTVLWLQWSWQAICLWEMPVLCRARTDALFPRQVLHCAHGQNDDIQTLLLIALEVFIGCRQTIPVLWVRSRD